MNKVKPVLRAIKQLIGKNRFVSSQTYWEQRYTEGGTSGQGSYGKIAAFKAEILNNFVAERQIQSVIEFGCGDGNQLSLAQYPSYIGLDVSPSAIKLCIQRFQSDTQKSFFLYDPVCFSDHHQLFYGDLALSLDVVFHLVEDQIYELYLQHLFGAARRYVIIYSTNNDVPRYETAPHVRHRQFTSRVESQFPEWALIDTIPNRYQDEWLENSKRVPDFYIYERKS